MVKPFVSYHVDHFHRLFLGLHEHHHVPNIPCDRADQDIFLFHHLTYFHKMNAKAATKLIRALLMNKGPLEPVFHSSEVIIASDQPRSHQSQEHYRTQVKQKSNKKNYSENLMDFSTHVSNTKSVQ